MSKPEDDYCEFCGEGLFDCNCWAEDDFYSSEDWDIDEDLYDDYYDDDLEDDYDDDWDYYDDEDEDWG
jgi:hypothetical protein